MYANHILPRMHDSISLDIDILLQEIIFDNIALKGNHHSINPQALIQDLLLNNVQFSHSLTISVVKNSSKVISRDYDVVKKQRASRWYK